MSRVEKLFLSLSELFRVTTFHSEMQQDKWVAEFIFPGVKDGYFVDVGSADGVRVSNSKTLEARGWRGICVDPFPTNMETRTCRLFRQAVSDVSGQEIDFIAAGFHGGIEGLLYEENKQGKLVGDARTVTLSTTTLNDILREANAPRFIHYLSLDIEGAELAALKGFSFVEYKVGALTVEHNYKEPKRRLVKELLLENGYRHVLSRWHDDFYVSGDLAFGRTDGAGVGGSARRGSDPALIPG